MNRTFGEINREAYFSEFYGDLKKGKTEEEALVLAWEAAAQAVKAAHDERRLLGVPVEDR